MDYEERYRQHGTPTFAHWNTFRHVEVTRSSVNEVGGPANNDTNAWLARRDGFSNGLLLL